MRGAGRDGVKSACRIRSVWALRRFYAKGRTHESSGHRPEKTLNRGPVGADGSFMSRVMDNSPPASGDAVAADGRRWLDIPASGADLLRRLPALSGAALLGLSALLPWSRLYPYSRRSGLDTARILLGLHRPIALLPSQSVAWLWCLVPVAAAMAWAVAWLAPPRAGLAICLCGLVAGLIVALFGISAARHHAGALASGSVVAAVGALTLILSGPLCCNRSVSPRPAEAT